MRRIENYALLGDLQTAALIEPRAAPSTGAAFRVSILAPASQRSSAALRTGAGSLAPATEITRHERRYRHDTLILESVFQTVEGRVRAIDFMPPRGDAPEIVRIVEGLDGSVPMRSELVIRFDYGRIVPWVRRVDGARLAVAGPDALCFRTPVGVRGEDMSTVSEFTLEPGSGCRSCSRGSRRMSSCRRASTPENALAETEAFWLGWANACAHHGDYHEEIHQSLLVLKALTYAPTGGTWPHRPPRYPNGSAVCATGTIASAGCGTPA